MKTWLDGAAVETAADKTAKAKESKRVELKAIRNEALVRIEHDFKDGRVMQVPASVREELREAIKDNKPEEWVMKDNRVYTVTVAEMKEAMRTHKKAVRKAWNVYKRELKKL